MVESIEIVEQMEVLLGELKKSLGAKSSKPTRDLVAVTEKSDLAFNGLTGEIYDLVQAGFFKEPRTISQIQEKLRLEGIKKPTTTLMSPLLSLVRKKVLRRGKPAEGKGHFEYQQR